MSEAPTRADMDDVATFYRRLAKVLAICVHGDGPEAEPARLRAREMLAEHGKHMTDLRLEPAGYYAMARQVLERYDVRAARRDLIETVVVLHFGPEDVAGDLANYLGLAPTTIDKWFSLSADVPEPHYQRIKALARAYRA